MSGTRTLALAALVALCVGAGGLWATPARAAFPGTNGTIIFRTDRDGYDAIYSMNPDGSAQTKLTGATDHLEYDPAVSPEGLRIAYARKRIGARSSNLFVMTETGNQGVGLTGGSEGD